MKPLIVFASVLFVTGNILADPYSEAIRQAKDVSGRVTEQNRQLMNNPLTTPTQDNSSQTNNPVLQATLQNIEHLRKDFVTLAGLTNSAAITVERQGLAADLTAAAQGIKPPAESISKLANDLASVIVGNDKLRPQHPRLAQYVHASFNGSQLTVAQQQMIFTEIQKMLVDGGTAPDDATNVVNDIKTIVGQTK